MFLVFEGVDGSGKSTQARLLAEHLREVRGLDVLQVREPGGTELGDRLRELLLDPRSGEMAPETELFLFMAARSHLVRTRILPALSAGQVVISDRFTWSSAVYQGLAAGCEPREILRIGRLAAPGLTVSRTFLIDLDPDLCFSRVVDPNRMEGKGVEFQRRVRSGFLDLAKKYASRFAVIDGAGTETEVHERVLSRLPVRGWSTCSRT
jgi:dTMP kinase